MKIHVCFRGAIQNKISICFLLFTEKANHLRCFQQTDIPGCLYQTAAG